VGGWGGVGVWEPHLNGDVEARDVEGLEHDLGGVLPVLWRVQRRLCLVGREETTEMGIQSQEIA